MTFSLVIPVRNGENFLEQAIDSALKQTRPFDEVVVLDDNSADRTAEIARSGRWAGRLAYRFNERPSGFADAYGRAAALATGQFITILHHDDMLDPNYLEQIERAVLAYPQVAHLYAACRYIDAEGRLLKLPPAPHSLTPVLYSGPEYAHRYLQGMIANDHIHRCPGVTTARMLMVDHCGYRKDGGHITDDDFFLRIGAFSDVVGISQPLASYREHGESSTSCLSSLPFTLSRDLLWQVRCHRQGPTLLSSDDIAALERYAVRVISQLLFRSVRGRDGQGVCEAHRFREEMCKLSPGRFDSATPRWARPLWRLTPRRLTIMAEVYAAALVAGLAARNFLRRGKGRGERIARAAGGGRHV